MNNMYLGSVKMILFLTLFLILFQKIFRLRRAHDLFSRSNRVHDVFFFLAPPVSSKKENVLGFPQLTFFLVQRVVVMGQ